jgi:hypothetical protein
MSRSKLACILLTHALRSFAAQFVQISLRLSATYRFPLPPLTVQFLDGIKFLEFLDIAQVPMNVDCYRHLRFGIYVSAIARDRLKLTFTAFTW